MAKQQQEHSIKDRAVLVKFTDRTYRGGMIDKTVGAKVMKDANAKSTVGHFWKRLLPAAALNPRLNVGMNARAYHTSNTLPWLEGGIRILPIAMYDEYMREMRKFQQQAVAEEKKLLKEYPAWIDEAKRTHGKLFNAAHFPTVDEISRKFSIDVDVLPLPNVNDWRVDLSAEQADELRRQAEATMAAVSKEGVREMYGNLHELLEHAKERLSDPEAKFKNSLVKNIRELAARLVKLNVTGDKELEALRKETEEMFKDLDPEELRDNKEKRAKVAKDAGAIMRKMATYMKG